MIEEWRIIPEFPRYEISNLGGVKSFTQKDPYILGGNIVGKGYYAVSLHKFVNKKKVIRRKYIHRLVAEIFIPNPLNKEEVNHKDGNKLNNYMTNLEWVTKSENMQHAVKMGLFHTHDCKGKNNGRSKLSEDEVRNIRKSTGVSEKIAKEYGITGQQVRNIRRGVSWKHLN